MIQTTESIKIPDSEVLRDYKITRNELDAYTKLLEGYQALNNLQDQSEENRTKYRYQIMLYEVSSRDCKKFLDTLESLLKIRGIEIPAKKVK
jgi:hypothetical protein